MDDNTYFRVIEIEEILKQLNRLLKFPFSLNEGDIEGSYLDMPELKAREIITEARERILNNVKTKRDELLAEIGKL